MAKNDLVDLAQGIGRIVGILLFIFGLCVMSCDASSIDLQLLLGCGGLAMVIVGTVLAKAGMEEEYDC